MNAIRTYIAFRRIYESVPKCDQSRFLRYTANTVHDIRTNDLRYWDSLTARSVESHLRSQQIDGGWWFVTKDLACTDIFQRLVAMLTPPRYCAHHAPIFCTVCLPVAAVKM